MNQNPSYKENMNITTTTSRINNSSNTNVQNQQQPQHPQLRGRSRQRQFRIFASGADQFSSTRRESISPPTTITNAPRGVNIVVPSHIGSDTSLINSRRNVIAKSSLPTQYTFNAQNYVDDIHDDDDAHLPEEITSWMDEQTHAPKKENQLEKPVKSKESVAGNAVKTAGCKSSCMQARELDVKHWKQRISKYHTDMESCGDAAKLNKQLNEIFVRRLVDVENMAMGDADIKLVIYQEWVDMLMQINEVIIANMADLESEVAKRLDCMKRRIEATCSNHSTTTTNDSNAQNYRQDICSLLQLLKNAYYHDNWDVQGLEFQTVNIAEILGARNINKSRAETECASNVINASITKQQCSANDLPAAPLITQNRDDEICALKQKICCLEEEIQKAQSELQLRDNVLNELHNELKCVNTKLIQSSSNICQCGGGESTTSLCEMPPINSEGSPRGANTQVTAGVELCNQLSLLNDANDSYDSLSMASRLEHNKLKTLEQELNEFFEVAEDAKRKSLEYHRMRLTAILKKSEDEKAEAYRKLDFIRKQLINLETSSTEPTTKVCTNDSDSGFSSKCESDQNAKIISALRSRFCWLHERNADLENHVQKLDMENKVLSISLHAKENFDRRSSDTLKQLADMLSSMSGKQFAYEDIYNDNCGYNPFCQAVMQIKDDFEKRERNLRESLLKSRCEENDSLRCEIQHLQCTIADKDQIIDRLNSMLEELRCQQQQQAQKQRCHDHCLQAEQNEFLEMAKNLEKANAKVQSLMCDLERSKKQERFLLGETRKLNQELTESRQKHNDLTAQAQRLNSLLKSQDSCQYDIRKKYEELERNYEEQAKQLRAAYAQMNCLQQRLATMEKRQEEHHMERNLLRDEVLALKEKESILLNKQKCLAEQLLNAEKELYKAHDLINEQKRIMQRNECAQRECAQRLQEANYELKRQFTSLCDDYQQLEEEYKKQCDLQKQNEKLIESFRTWKELQMKADDKTKASFKQYDEHIKLLLEEKQRFIEQFRRLSDDYCTLQRELDNIKMRPLSCHHSAPNSNLSENSVNTQWFKDRFHHLRLST